MKRLKALHKLAKDILASEPGSKIDLNEELFQNTDTDQISFTLKNYERPNGVATQIFGVELIGYEA